jgi:two-component system cell cycle response regulator DivK
VTGNSLKVLLVEDNALNRDMLSRRLGRAGFTVITAEDGAAALDEMRANAPDAVLLDMNLPIKDGWTVASEAKQDPALATIPIIALTAHAMEADRQKALSAGCDDYATKPIDFPALVAKLEALL